MNNIIYSLAYKYRIYKSQAILSLFVITVIKIINKSK